MTSYLGPVPNIPTLSPVRIYADDQYELKDQLDDMHIDIAFIVNDKKRRDQYLQTEDVTTDTYVNGEVIFRKVIPTGVLNQGATNNIAHGITGLVTLVNIFVNVSNGTNQRMLGYASPNVTDMAAVDVNGTNVVILTGATFGANYSGQIYIFYTKS